MPEGFLNAMTPLTEAHLRLAMDAMPVAVAAFDPFGRVLCWNREAERLTGWSFAALQGRGLECLFPDPLERALLLEEWGRRGEGFQAWEWSLLGRDGRRRCLRWSSQALLRPVPGWASWMVGTPVQEQAPWREPAREPQRIASMGESRLAFRAG